MNAIIKQQRLLIIFLKLLFNRRSQQQNATYIFFFVQLIILFILFTHSHKSSLLVSKLSICEIIVCNTKEVKKRYLSYRRYWVQNYMNTVHYLCTALDYTARKGCLSGENILSIIVFTKIYYGRRDNSVNWNNFFNNHKHIPWFNKKSEFQC